MASASVEQLDWAVGDFIVKGLQHTTRLLSHVALSIIPEQYHPHEDETGVVIPTKLTQLFIQAAMPLSPEQAIKKLSRTDANCVCPNCGTKSKYGFSTVCIKYNTFVCNNCKSSHQAISHKCKSLTMSSWSMREILEIKTTGNDYCRRVWLGCAPPVGANGRPKEGESSMLLPVYILYIS